VALIWSVPVLAAAVATLVVVAWSRSLEDEATALAHDVARLAEVRKPLSAVRSTVEDTGDLVRRFGAAHPLDTPSSSDPGGPADGSSL
jgi:hypothetical protein